MADHEAAKINHENHYLLDQPLLRLPHELLRQNFRFAHLAVEKESQPVKTLLKATATTASLNGSSAADDVVRNLDAMLARMRGLKRKLAGYADEEARLHRQLDARAAHLAELAGMQTVEDVKYEAWSRRRLDRLLVDYMLRNGYDGAAAALADERGMRDLVDVDTFVAMSTIRRSLEEGSVQEALAWCSDNKKELRKMDSNLEFMLRCQQYVEMVRTGTDTKLMEAIAHATKFIVPYDASYPTEVQKIGGLLAHRADTTLEPYASWYSPERWKMLADLFVRTHNTLLGLPSLPLLHIALSSGLSALKTPACHSTSGVTGSAQPSRSASLTTNVCPICSTELNELARGVPYAHHGKSHVEHDLVLLPNGRAYGRDRLDEYAGKAGLAPGMVKDLVTGEVYADHTLKKVFIT